MASTTVIIPVGRFCLDRHLTFVIDADDCRANPRIVGLLLNKQPSLVNEPIGLCRTSMFFVFVQSDVPLLSEPGLHIAAEQFHVAMVEVIVSCVDVNVLARHDGQTALELAKLRKSKFK